MKADDYGCLFADSRLIKAYLFPYKLDSIREADLIRWMDELQKADLIVLYEVDSKKYLQVKDFNQRLRTKKSKYPLPGLQDGDVDESYVYFIGYDDSMTIKVGFSVNPWARVKEISTGTHKTLKVLFTFTGTKKDEKDLHKILSDFKEEREWFTITKAAFDFIKRLSELKVTAKSLSDQLRSNLILLRSNEIEREIEVEVEEKEFALTSDAQFFFTKNKKTEEQAPGAEIFTIEHCLTVAMNDDRWVNDSKATINLLTQFNQSLSGQGIYEKNPKDYKRHFYHWFKKQKNGTHQQSPGKVNGGKSAGANILLDSLKQDIASLAGPGS